MPCHQGDVKKLPKDVKKFLDDAEDGFIIFSLGTNVKSSLMPKEILNGIIKVLGELNKVRVLWKFEKEDLENCPENVKISKWLQQQDVLGTHTLKRKIGYLPSQKEKPRLIAYDMRF
jgi:glucuronosyltransferase